MIPPVVCDLPGDVAFVEALSEYRLRVRFHDGVEGTVDLSRRVHAPDAGVFAALRDPSRFSEVGIEFGAVWWPCGVDLAPDAMHDELQRRGGWTL